MKVKLKDLAQMCGVDASTVSRAIKNDPRISRATRERVQADVQIGDVGYFHNT